MSYDLVIFDCDGVILNSNVVKTDAFREALIDEKEDLVEQFIKYHKINGGVSRYRKFEYFFSKIKKDTNEKAVHEAIDKYAKIVKKELIICPMIKGVESYLFNLKKLGIPCFVNTGSDEYELKEVFQERGISHYFKDILGSPKNKIENMDRIKNLDGKKVLYFGDAKMDWEVSKKYNCDFIFVCGASEWHDGYEKISEVRGKIIQDFTEQIKKDL